MESPDRIYEGGESIEDPYELLTGAWGVAIVPRLLVTGASSSGGLSARLIIGRSEVQLFPGPPPRMGL